MVFNLKEKLRNKEAVVCVVGLGYVGLPLAEAFSKHLRVIGYDVNAAKIKKLSQNNEGNIEFTSDPANIREANPHGRPKKNFDLITYKREMTPISNHALAFGFRHLSC